MSTTSVSCLPPAASSRTARSLAALVTSTSSHVFITGMPVTISTGNPASGILAPLSGSRTPDHEQSDIIASWLAAHEGSHHRSAGCLRGLRGYSPAEPGQAVIDQLTRPL